MHLYTQRDIDQGIGAFDHVMHRASQYPTRYGGMSGAVGIGFLAAAMNSGLKREEIGDVIDEYLDPDAAAMLKTTRRMYNGDDPRIHLWNEDAERTWQRLFGPYLRFSRPGWRVDRYEDQPF